MEDQELKNIWKRSSAYEEITINISKLMKDFKYKMEQRERIVRSRDYREIIGALIGILLTGYLTYYTPTILSKLGGVLLIGSYMYFIYKLYTNRKSKHTQDLFLPIEAQLQHQKQFMMNQATLLSSVLYWMALPMFISYMILIWGVTDSFPEDTPSIVQEVLSIKLHSKIIWSITMALIFIYITRLNKRAAKVNWHPLIQQIDTIITQLKS